jgi:hypothetical protein
LAGGVDKASFVGNPISSQFHKFSFTVEKVNIDSPLLGRDGGPIGTGKTFKLRIVAVERVHGATLHNIAVLTIALGVEATGDLEEDNCSGWQG